MKACSYYPASRSAAPTMHGTLPRSRLLRGLRRSCFLPLRELPDGECAIAPLIARQSRRPGAHDLLNRGRARSRARTAERGRHSPATLSPCRSYYLRLRADGAARRANGTDALTGDRRLGVDVGRRSWDGCGHIAFRDSASAQHDTPTAPCRARRSASRGLQQAAPGGSGRRPTDGCRIWTGSAKRASGCSRSSTKSSGVSRYTTQRGPSDHPPAPRPPPSGASASAPPEARLLVVDDRPGNRPARPAAPGGGRLRGDGRCRWQAHCGALRSSRSVSCCSA
jgi:hypothetical protein